jgi:hypothetical protein
VAIAEREAVMADKPTKKAGEKTDGVGLSFTQLMGSLKLRMLCDDTGDQELSAEQEAAMHAFLHEVFASYYRLTTRVPEKKVRTIFNRRFASAPKDKIPRNF